MSNLISRQAAIETVRKAKDKSEAHRMLVQLPAAQPSVSKTEIVGDVISRQAAMVAVKDALLAWSSMPEWRDNKVLEAIIGLPSAQPERDIPKKPNVTIDKAWGIQKRQAVCPNCDSYLGMVNFVSDGGKTKITYCEACGQAINWKGWEDDESNKQAN